MAGTATYNPATRIIDVSADGLPNPVLYGTFPNANNPSSVTEQDFDHDFYFRGGTLVLQERLMMPHTHRMDI